MILVTGGISSGRHSYCINYLGLTADRIAEVRAVDCVLYDEESKSLSDKKSESSVINNFCSYSAVIATECGCGIVPDSAEKRILREQNGRLNIALAGRAEKVVRIVCGIPQVIKE